MATENPTRRFYDRISRVYDALTDAGEHRAREKGLELLAVDRGEHVLEIGYGTGHCLVKLAQAVGSVGRVRGVDISTGMYEVAWSRVQEAGVADHVELKVAEVPPIPYDDDLFDAVTLSFTLELFPDETIGAVLAEVRRVLRSRGRLGIVAMAEGSSGGNDGMMARAYKWLHRHFPHVVDCRPIDIDHYLGQAGFSIIQREDMAIWSLPVVGVVAEILPAPRR